MDLGCGVGQLTEIIRQKGAEVTGIDLSETMIADAKTKFPDIIFLVADASNFAFQDPFDAIFSNAALHWVLEKEKAINCIYNALKPAGRFVAEFGGKGNINSILTQLKTPDYKRLRILATKL